MSLGLPTRRAESRQNAVAADLAPGFTGGYRSDEYMPSEISDDELPDAPTALEMLLNASTEPNLQHKRAGSCPPQFDKFSLDDLTADIGNLSMVLPNSDPIEAPLSYHTSRKDTKRMRDAPDLSEINADNAQTILDPDACLFVANLPIHIANQEIQVALAQFMAKDTEIFVKVHRTRAGLPFAHVQYLDVDTAVEMLDKKHGQLLWNRQLRIERASANRFLFVGYRNRYSDRPTEPEMLALFSGFEIEWVRDPTPEEKEASRVDNCLIVHFARWGECGEALRSLRSHSTYWMKAPHKSHLAPPNVGQVQQRIYPEQQQMIMGQLPIVHWFGDFASTMPYFFPCYTEFPPVFDNSLKRRKRNYRHWDALPPPNSVPKWSFNGLPLFPS